VGIPNPRLVVEYLTNGATFGPSAVDGIIHDASSVGWSWYSRYPANCYFTLPQTSIHNARLLPLRHHVRVTYINDATGYSVVVFQGRLSDPDESGEDVVWTAWNYLAELSLSRTGYRTLYQNKLIGTEIAGVEWGLAKAATSSLFGHVTTGTIEDPLALDNVTKVKTDARFGVIDVPRLLLLFDLTEIGRANTLNNVTFEITRVNPTFNFWKNRGSAYTAKTLLYPGIVRDFRFVPGYGGLRNDLATIGTTAGGGATEITKSDATSAATYGLRQDVFTIKTLAGIVGAATEADAQQAITSRALKEATQLSRNVSVDVRSDLFEPFDGYDIEDTIPVSITRGRTSVIGTYRIVGLRGVMDNTGYHPQVVLQLPTAA
jgi:hypothetical protein